MNKVMRIIKEKKLEIVTQIWKFNEETDYRLEIQKREKKCRNDFRHFQLYI
jgi:hypothetical protein